MAAKLPLKGEHINTNFIIIYLFIIINTNENTSNERMCWLLAADRWRLTADD